jgi:hypothetical protein
MRCYEEKTAQDGLSAERRVKFRTVVLALLGLCVLPLSAVIHAEEAAPAKIVLTTDTLPYQGQQSLRIATPMATFIHHLEGGGFASLLDADGKDWISYRPGDGPAGEYRGIPNAVYRAKTGGRSFFHPGNKGDNASKTSVIEHTSDLVRLRSVSADGNWETEWEIRPDHARFTMTRMDPQSNWWFLYEGTPGGVFDENDLVLRADEKPSTLAKTWASRAPQTPWVAFVSKERKRALLFVMENPPDVPMSYFAMRPMTVFGFGRDLGRPVSHLSTAPVSVTLRFVESDDEAVIRAAAEAAMKR